ncbi:hypothetical protein IAI10_17880 [Clostridium sp. 19966]|uniref:hypothetical protein n=1 Tax=Clostridium sp. 19966 TaxID=2768166 RepID=UPI0028DDCE75|nr:hypothetical protein [Clostridium sp. 19966]MDT8718537.1 hypothetical protein [Clostridium sp. 19966]
MKFVIKPSKSIISRTAIKFITLLGNNAKLLYMEVMRSFSKIAESVILFSIILLSALQAF